MRTDSDGSNVRQPVVQPCPGDPCLAVGEGLRAHLSDDELDFHIEDLAWAWRTAYARFEAYGLPADRDEALMLLHLHDQAVVSRSPAAQAARWAEIDRAIDEGVGYFCARGAADRAAMEKAGA